LGALSDPRGTEVALRTIMRSHQSDYSTATLGALDFVDVTDEVESRLRDSGIREGMVTVFAPDRACVLVVNERESGLIADIRETLARLESSKVAAQRAMLGSSSVVLPATEGRLRLGVWQRVLLIELEAPQERKIVVQIVGE
jgi:secondary thiamine-phosphate synthase enzyme